MRREKDQDREDRDCQRQRARRQIASVDRPKPGAAGQHGEPEDDRLGRKNPDEYLEEARDRGRPEGGEGADQRDDAKEAVRGVRLHCGLHQRQEAEQCNAEAQCFMTFFPSGRGIPSGVYDTVRVDAIPPGNPLGQSRCDVNGRRAQADRRLSARPTALRYLKAPRLYSRYSSPTREIGSSALSAQRVRRP